MKRLSVIKKRIIICLLLAGVCLFTAGSFYNVSAQETGTSGMYVDGTFTMFGRIGTVTYYYDDDFFLAPPDRYDHDLARLSLGLALAAGRNMKHPDEQEDYLIAFLQDLGFSGFETETYRTNPTADSIAYGLAAKKIGDTTILACAVCGGDYGMEWASNLTVGDSIRSEGFEDASRKVRAAVKEYMEENSITGTVKLWITGYSRAGAVSNITAADFTDEDLFDSVYAYTFATPRTTREPGSYSNIFNILQKEDVVPKVPLADWGYERYGTDLFLKSPETDSDCADLLERESELYREMTGAEMVVNSEINYHLRTLMDYLLTLMPDSATYTKYLQPLIIDIMIKSDGTKNALEVLLEALEQYSTDDPAAAEELKAMRDYLGVLVNTYLLRETLLNLPPNRWEPGMGILNLFNAHSPFEYLAMMYASDDPEQIFSDNTEYIRLMIYAEKVHISISRDGIVLKEILPDGTELVDGRENPYSFPDADCYPDKTVITLPADQFYRISVTSEANLPQTISYTGILCSGHTVRAKTDDLYSYLLMNGETAEIVSSLDGKAIEPSKSAYTDVSIFTELVYSPTTAMKLENNLVIHLTISGLVNRLLFLVVLLFVQMIASIILTILRKKKRRKRNVVVALIWHSIVALPFALLEVSMWYFVPILTIAKMIPGTLVFVVISVYAIKGCRTESRRWKACWILIGALAAYVILESLLIGEFTVVKGILLIAVYAGFMAAAFLLLWRRKKAGEDRAGHDHIKW